MMLVYFPCSGLDKPLLQTQGYASGNSGMLARLAVLYPLLARLHIGSSGWLGLGFLVPSFAI